MSIKSSLRQNFFFFWGNESKRDSRVAQTRHTFLSRSNVFWLCYVQQCPTRPKMKMNTFLFFRAWFYTRVAFFLWSYAIIYIFVLFEKSHKSRKTKLKCSRAAVDYEIFLESVRIYYFSLFFADFMFVVVLFVTAVNQKLIPSQRWWVAGYANRWRIAVWPQSGFGLEMNISHRVFSLSSSNTVIRAEKRLE